MMIAVGIVGMSALPQALAELSGEVEIGSIIPLTGKLARSGEENKIGYELGVEHFNKYLADKDAGWSLKVVSEDSQTSPTVTLEKVQSLYARDIQHVIGPQSSGNIQNIKGYVDANNILIISPSSTSPLLAIGDDSIFRLAPDDSNQAVALVRVLQDAEIDAIVPIWRDEAWGVGLEKAIRESFPAAGGVVHEGISYNPEANDFSSEASLLAEIVREYVDEYGAEHVGVAHFGFGETQILFQSAASHDILSDVRWFGADAVTKDTVIVDDPISLKFATDTQFTTLQVAAGKNDKTALVEEAVEEALGRTPRTYASSAYDAIWLLGLSMEKTQSTDVNDLVAVFSDVAAEHQGALGSTALNEFGDLAQTNYDVWNVSGDKWTHVGVYYASVDSVTLSEKSMMMSDEKLSGEVEIGSIIPLTGKLARSGEENKIGYELGVEHFNKYLADKDAGWSLKVVSEDSQTSPTVTLEKVQSLYARDIQHVIGPQSSGNIQNIKGYVDANNILIISPSSTSPLLAIGDDSIFRLAPDDSNQAVALVRVLQDAEIDAIVPIWRDEAWGVGLEKAIRESFPAAGGVVHEGISYNPEANDFSSEASLLAEIVREYVDEYGAEHVGVAHFGFGETQILFQSAASHDILSDVRWFGADAVTKDTVIVDDPISLKFATDTQFTTLQVAAGKNDKTALVEEAVEEALGRTPRTYASSAYDAIWLLGLSMEKTQSTDVNDLVAVFSDVAAEHQGALGSTALNEFGDLAQTNYDVWNVSGDKWTHVGVYYASVDSVTLSEKLSGVINIGEIAPLSGDWSSNGLQNSVATEFAINEFNAYLADKGASWSFELTTEDSQTLPTTALEKIQSLNAKNIKHIIGPQTSASLQQAKQYADLNNMLIISCCSTSPLLAVDDSVFRLVPDDSNQAFAIAKLLEESGIEVVVPVWRNDAWGQGLHDALVTSFTAGTIVEGISYNPEGSEFSAETSLLADAVQKQVDDLGSDKVGVVYIGFGEAIPFFQSSSAHDVLKNVLWFGSDGSAKLSEFIDDPITLQFATDTLFTAVVVSSGKNAASDSVDAAVEAELGSIPTAYASSAYDAIWLLGLSMESAQSTDVDVLTEIIPKVAAGHTGALGPLILNDNGDLAQANYEMWTVANDNWIYTGVYVASSDSIDFDDDAIMMLMETTEPKDAMADDEVTKAADDGGGGGCLIATAAYGSELAPQVQMLREIRDTTLLSTESGTSFMAGFNQVYYAFSPAVADLEREIPIFQDMVRAVITPAMYTLNIMTLADTGSDASVIAFGILSIVAIVAIYLVAPYLTARVIAKKVIPHYRN